MKLAIITNNFPHPRFPQSGAFVSKLAEGMSKHGADITVYSLISKTNLLFKRDGARANINYPDKVQVNHISYISFSNFNIFGFSTAEIGHKLSQRKLENKLSVDLSVCKKPDFLYGKFLLSGARKAVELSKKYSIPAVADLGESTLLSRLAPRQVELAREIAEGLTGAVCVSPRLVKEVVELGLDASRVLLMPNGVDTSKFFPTDKVEARKHLKLPPDKKVVVFVGHFIHRKGPDRLLQAIEKLPPEYHCILLGEGPIELCSPRILFKGRVPNDKLNMWLNAADVFCLPTLAEGSCNAIEEARAAGLPIVTSRISDITDFDSANEYTLVDPMNVSEIASGILDAVHNCRHESKHLPITNTERSSLILDWLKDLRELESK